MVDCIEEEALNAMEKAKTKTRSALLEKPSEKTYKNYVIYIYIFSNRENGEI